MTLRVAINGFGRMGRNFLRAAFASKVDLEIVCINDLANTAVLAHMVKYDSILGTFPGDITYDDATLRVNGAAINATSETDPAALPWHELDVDVVIESTGRFTKASDARKHIDAGARKVIISAPATEEDITIVLGVNEQAYDPARHTIISNASCTTNCVAPMAKVLLDNFGFVRGYMTTVHAYTTEQQLLDQIAMSRSGQANLRRMRAAAINIVPSTTGAARATSLVIPELKGRLDGIAFRVPVPTGSVTDLVVTLDREASKDEINSAFRSASQSAMRGILAYTEDEIVSSDIVGTPPSCTFDSALTMSSGNQVKVVGWYDNEWGYSNRLVDLSLLIGRQLRA
ncbi:type I glyceraldehyde-3-phosphate dehydrogenase [Bradyrhizobium cytisi]|uniref:Type I glyceraldehyde-3-phosphate dehydrogenase n=1 Tax=Bradyrhizobium cytisi TaxID=515489 RepID=A0A5S4WYP5_9BRAD|nr:type I glyceraldehyde-3-phosphate dehydrogenase [Bradyrhizobium cytisi]TYL85812.1 type I glyceraldehyde-3-phosphate dehydrogenase [Bradyrhizobium cytisi]